MILVDTNILVYAVNSDAPQHAACRALVEAVRTGDSRCALVPQVLLEFYAIVTDRRRVAKPLDTAQAREAIEALRSIFPVPDAGAEALGRLPGAIAEKTAAGGEVFDAWLVAQMRVLGMDRICTYNAKNFAGYEGIRALRPGELTGGEQKVEKAAKGKNAHGK